MKIKTAFVCFFPIFKNYTGSTEVINARFKYWKGDKKIFQLSDKNCSKKNFETVTMFKNTPLFKIFALPILIYKVYIYLNSKNKKILAIEGASWIFYSFSVTYILKKILPDLSIYYFSHSIESKIRKKFSNVLIYKMTFFLEKKLLNRCDYVTSVSIKEKREIEKLYGVKTIILPNFIDLEKKFKKKKTEKKSYLIYCGSYLYKPNKEAIDYLNKEIMPILAKKKNIYLIITGGGYTGKKYEWLIDKQIVKKPDLYQLIFNSLCMCLPLNFGSGTRIKILEALSLGAIVVSTEVGIEGIELNKLNPPFIFNNKKKLIKILLYIIQNFQMIKKLSVARKKYFLSKYSAKNKTRFFFKNYVKFK